jgi:hypothetical protein
MNLSPLNLWASGLAMVALLPSCRISSDHVVETRHEIKPIEINVNVKVEKELDSFFDDLDQASTTVANPVSTVAAPESEENEGELNVNQEMP